MNKDEVQEIVKIAIRETVKELRREGLLNDDFKQAIYVIEQRLKAYYAGKPDERLAEALDSLRNDMYFDIIPMYYFNRYTIENISEKLHSGVATVHRHKKRLLIELYFETT